MARRQVPALKFYSKVAKSAMKRAKKRKRKRR